ncbi:MAG: thioredoxin domain-containing protein [Thermoflavifilum sp.]|nr:thioredoxin domain-containing protein [Thermoflavifilum sp.]
MSETNLRTNALINETSPYLLQHAHNPVNWYAWKPEVLQHAQQEQKLLLISIGYAACHWCHVMEKEVFSNVETAQYMNAHFVCIKIDREERPDLDQIYMQACLLINGHGGWPLNAFALPDGKPFYATTYLPLKQWRQLLAQIVSIYHQQPDQLRHQAEQLTEGIHQSFSAIQAPIDSEKTILQQRYTELWEHIRPMIDMQYGGFSHAPKFPMPAVWEWLLQYAYFGNHQESLQAVSTTLHQLALSSLYDPISGGFARYATDARWRIPHFEKMLYDNAQLISLYAHAYALTHQPNYVHIISHTTRFIQEWLSHEQGGYFAAVDADSEGEEGKYYVWTITEIQQLLDPGTASLICAYYHITPEGNWEHGKNILFRTESDESFAQQHGLSLDAWQKILQQALNRMRQYQQKRTRPAIDTQVITAWNALLLKAWTDAYKATGLENFRLVALQLASFLERHMMHEDGALWRVYAQGQTHVPAMLDDYAFLAEAWIALYQISFDIHWLLHAKKLLEYTIAHFADPQGNLFFYTSNEQRTDLQLRSREIEDNVIPSSNAAMAQVLYWLGIYFQRPDWQQWAMRMLQQVLPQINSSPAYMAKWNQLLGLVQKGVYEIAIMGDHALDIALELQKHYLPNCLLMGGTEENLPLLKNKSIPGQTWIYVCQQGICHAPLKTVDEALSQIKPHFTPNLK